MMERLLKSEMMLHGDNLNSLSDYLKIARQTLSKKMKEGSFTQDEMIKIKSRYNLSNEQFGQIFTQGVGLNEGK